MLKNKRPLTIIIASIVHYMMIFQDLFFKTFVSRLSVFTTCSHLCGTRLSPLVTQAKLHTRNYQTTILLSSTLTGAMWWWVVSTFCVIFCSFSCITRRWLVDQLQVFYAPTSAMRTTACTRAIMFSHCLSRCPGFPLFPCQHGSWVSRAGHRPATPATTAVGQHAVRAAKSILVPT